MKIFKLSKLLLLTSFAAVQCSLAPAQDFSSGDLTGWKSIGAVSVVSSSYAPTILTGNAALLETGAGAVSIEQVFTFLEAEGFKMEPWVWERIREEPGAVGSAIVSEFLTTSEEICIEAYGLSNNRDTYQHDRGAYALHDSGANNAGSGPACTAGAVGFTEPPPGAINALWEASGTPYAFEMNRDGGVGSSSGDPVSRKVAYFVWESDPNEPDAGSAILVLGLPEQALEPPHQF